MLLDGTALRSEFLVLRTSHCAQEGQQLASLRRIQGMRALDFCFAHLHDILIFFRSREEHERHLWALFDKFQTYIILINMAKCIFRESEVTLLGYKVTTEGYRTLKERVTHLQNCPLPKPPLTFAASWIISTRCRCYTGTISWYSPRAVNQRLSSHWLDAGSPQDFRKVQDEFVTPHSTGASQLISATFHVRHGYRFNRSSSVAPSA
jgi:hypothetical protein